MTDWIQRFTELPKRVQQALFDQAAQPCPDCAARGVPQSWAVVAYTTKGRRAPYKTAPGIMNARQAARALGVHENTVRNWARAGFLTDVRVPGSKQRRYSEAEVEALASERKEA